MPTVHNRFESTLTATSEASGVPRPKPARKAELISTPPRQPDAVIAQAMLAAAVEQPAQPATEEEVAALERLLAVVRAWRPGLED